MSLCSVLMLRYISEASDSLHICQQKYVVDTQLATYNWLMNLVSYEIYSTGTVIPH